MSVLETQQLSVAFHSDDGLVHAVQDLSLSCRGGQTLGLVGESGCGKSTAAMALMGLLPPAARIRSGQALLDGATIVAPGRPYPTALRGRRIGMIFQDPMTCLNPYLTIAHQFALPLRRHLGLSRQAARERSISALRQVGIPDPAARLNRYPHEFSGGQRQRLMIALALCCEPDILIADEPTTALDVTIQAQILNLIRHLQQERGLALLLITHDLGVVAQMCDEVIVMYAGRAVEQASAAALFSNPSHPYTRALLSSMPRLDSAPGERLRAIPGMPPRLYAVESACAFAPRCPQAREACQAGVPGLRTVSPGHRAACVDIADAKESA